MATERATVGNVEIVSVSDGLLPVHPSFLFSGVPPEMYSKALGGEPAPDGSLPITRGSFLVRSSGRTVLVDTGIGDKHPGARGGELLDNLAKLGVRPDEIDVVVNTHLHFDHVGWNCLGRDGAYVPTFPKAEYWIARAEWDFWTEERVLREEGPHLASDVLPLKDSAQLRLVDGEAAITRELSLLPTPGHTPGHCSIAVASAGERAIILGDVAHHPLHLTRFWVCAIDELPRLSRRTKRAIAERLIAEGALAAAGHFTPNPFGHLVLVDGRRVWRPL
ncbi:MAG: MBL fold metallo-hydrolase [Chloroflexi bacterium]|nr:MBL fold metallo-hydrolase [Chloroflexota bacterium]